MEQKEIAIDLESTYHRLNCGIAILSAMSDGLHSNVGDEEYSAALWGVSDYLRGISGEIRAYILAQG